jgi:hypothetical protein
MLTTVALLSVLGLAPGQADGLTLTGVQLTHGVLGPTRANAQLLPGDSLYVSFTIEGISADAAGKVKYQITTEVSDPNGKVTFKSPGRVLDAINALGGNSLPAYARIDVGLDEILGKHTAAIVVTDMTTMKTTTLKQEFTVLPKAFGAVRLSLTKDAEGLTPAGLLGTGESVWVNTSVVGFARDANTKQPRVSFELRVLGPDGKPTVSQPFTGVVEKNVLSSAVSLPVQFLLPLNRSGKFTVEITAMDKVSGKESRLSFPLVVLAPSK